MADRFFADSPISGDHAELTGPEAHHAIHVMRLGVGDSVTVFDGSGMEFEARIEAANRRSLSLAVVERRAVDRELPFELTLAVALPKGDRQRWLVEKATELGVTRLVPLVTARSVAQPSSSALKRLERAVVEASKQCGRNVLMKVDAPEKWLSFVVNRDLAEQRWIADPAEDSLSLGEAKQTRGGTEDLIVAIGPEGGFDESETQAASEAGWKRISLGSRILRIETAALALVAAVQSG